MRKFKIDCKCSIGDAAARITQQLQRDGIVQRDPQAFGMAKRRIRKLLQTAKAHGWNLHNMDLARTIQETYKLEGKTVERGYVQDFIRRHAEWYNGRDETTGKYPSLKERTWPRNLRATMVLICLSLIVLLKLIGTENPAIYTALGAIGTLGVIICGISQCFIWHKKHPRITRGYPSRMN